MIQRQRHAENTNKHAENLNKNKKRYAVTTPQPETNPNRQNTTNLFLAFVWGPSYYKPIFRLETPRRRNASTSDAREPQYPVGNYGSSFKINVRDNKGELSLHQTRFLALVLFEGKNGAG